MRGQTGANPLIKPPLGGSGPSWQRGRNRDKRGVGGVFTSVCHGQANPRRVNQKKPGEPLISFRLAADQD